MPDAELNAAIRTLYASYLDAWNGRAFVDLAALFTQPSTFVLPNGSMTFADSPSLVAMFEKLFGALDEAGFDRSTTGAQTIRVCGPDMVILDVVDVTRWHKDGRVLDEIDGHYVLLRQNDGWRISVAVACPKDIPA